MDIDIFNKHKCDNIFLLFRIYIMATTENAESGSPENKAERRTGNSDTMYPLKVLYCGGIFSGALMGLWEQ